MLYRCILGIYCFVVFLVLAVEDVKKKSINVLILLCTFLPLPLLFWSTGEAIINYERGFGILLGVLFLVISFASRESVGRGDAYLIIWTGYTWGIFTALEILAYAWVLLFACAGWFLIKRIRKPIPFVPFLFAGYIIDFLLKGIGYVFGG